MKQKKAEIAVAKPGLISKLKAFGPKHKKLLTVTVAAVILISGWAYTSKKPQQVQYQTAKAEKGTLVSSVAASGQVLSTNIVNITTSASGVVQEIFTKDGTTVAAGDKIAQIRLDAQGQQQNLQAWASYSSAKSSLDAANATLYSLQSDMFAKWKTYLALAQNSTYQNSDGSPNDSNRTLPEFHISQDDWLGAEAKYKNQQAVIAAAQANVSSAWADYQSTSSTVTAPISGTVSNIGIVAGMTLGSQGSSVSVGTGGAVQSNQNSQRVAVIQNEGVPIATFNVSEVDISRIKAGQSATVTIDAISGKTFTGKVATVDHIGAVTSGVTNYTVLISFDTSSTEVLPNMAVTAQIITDVKDSVLLVPSTAIQTTGGQPTVRIMKNGKPESVNVETGNTSDTQTEIISGVNEGDTIITGTSSAIRTGSQGQSSGSPFGGSTGGGAFRAIGGGGR